MAMHIQIQVLNDAELRGKLKRMGVDVRKVHDRAIEAAAEVIQAAATSKAPGPEIGREQVKAAEWHVGPDRNAWYYRFFETGTRAHFVKPYRRRALRFFEGGQEYFSRGHEVSGIAARPFLRPAIDEHSDEASDAAGNVIKQVLR